MLTLLPDLNFAALKYAYALKEHGGPISSVSYLEQERFDAKCFEGFAELDEKTGAKARTRVFGANKSDAINGAISEALKLWAMQAAKRDPVLRETNFLHKDPSSRGFAAFPGLGVQGAMKRALFDAARCWTVATWLEGAHVHSKIPAPGFEAIQIKGPIRGLAVILMWRDQRDQTGAFASAAGATPAAALEAAKFRLILAEERGESPYRSKVLDRLGTATGKMLAAPKLIVDSPLRGRWSDYAHVWRCLFDSAAIRGNDRGDEFLC